MKKLMLMIGAAILFAVGSINVKAADPLLIHNETGEELIFIHQLTEQAIAATGSTEVYHSPSFKVLIDDNNGGCGVEWGANEMEELEITIFRDQYDCLDWYAGPPLP